MQSCSCGGQFGLVLRQRCGNEKGSSREPTRSTLIDAYLPGGPALRLPPPPRQGGRGDSTEFTPGQRPWPGGLSGVGGTTALSFRAGHWRSPHPGQALRRGVPSGGIRQATAVPWPSLSLSPSTLGSPPSPTEDSRGTGSRIRLEI